MAYATVDDLAARWHALTATESKQAAALLDDAAALIDAACSAGGVDVRPEAALIVSCAMVKRSMLAVDSAGITQQSESVGSFSQSFTWSNPQGDIYITRSERRLLGLGAQHGASVEL